MKTDIGYIYSLSSNRDNEIRYIGFTTNPKKRLNNHKSESKQLGCYRHNWIQKEIKEGYNLLMTIIKIISFENWEKEEIEIIAKYKEKGYNLTNTHVGGNGGEKIKGDKKRINIGNTWNKGRKPSEKNKLALDIARKRKQTKEHIEKRIKTFKEKNLGNKPNYSEDTVIKIFELFNNKHKISNISNIVNLKENTIANILYMQTTARKTKEKYNLIRTR